MRRLFYWPENLAHMEPATMRCVHFWVAAVTVFPGIPISLMLRNSLPYIVALSVIAITYSALAGWSAERPSGP